MKKSKNKLNVGKELVKRAQDINRNIETIMGKSVKPKPKTESLSVADGLVMYLYDAGDSARRFIRMDFDDYSTYHDFHLILDRSKLREVADFINKYLENK